MIEQLRQLTAPWFHYFIGSTSELTNFTWSICETGSNGRLVRTIRGTKMRVVEGVFDEFAAALQFPDYFGENWAALSECLADLSWLPAAGYVVVVRDSTAVLSEEGGGMYSILLSTLADVAKQWSTAIEQGEWWDRPAKPFHVVMQALPEGADKLFSIMRDAQQSMSKISWCPPKS
jgi:hypothetical protein